MDLGADHAPHFGFGHLPMQGIRDHQVDIVHTVVGEHLQHHFERGLPDVRGRHRRQRQADVVESDGDPHPRAELGVERVAAERVVQGVPDRAARVRQAPDGGRGIDHPGPHRKMLFEKILPVVQNPGRRILLDEDDVRIGLVAQGGSHPEGTLGETISEPGRGSVGSGQ